MTHLQNVLLAAVAGLVAGLIVLHFAPVQTVTNTVTTAGSSAGVTFNTAKTAGIVWAPVSNSASSTSVYNGDSSDRIITSAHYDCTGAAFTAGNSIAYVRFTAATTSGSSQGLNGNSNFVLDTNVGSSTLEVFVSSTTPGLTGTAAFRRWKSGSYLTFNTNATSTGESCIVGVNYLAS